MKKAFSFSINLRKKFIQFLREKKMCLVSILIMCFYLFLCVSVFKVKKNVKAGKTY